MSISNLPTAGVGDPRIGVTLATCPLQVYSTSIYRHLLVQFTEFWPQLVSLLLRSCLFWQKYIIQIWAVGTWHILHCWRVWKFLCCATYGKWVRKISNLSDPRICTKGEFYPWIFKSQVIKYSLFHENSYFSDISKSGNEFPTHWNEENNVKMIQTFLTYRRLCKNKPDWHPNYDFLKRRWVVTLAFWRLLVLMGLDEKKWGSDISFRSSAGANGTGPNHYTKYRHGSYIWPFHWETRPKKLVVFLSTVPLESVKLSVNCFIDFV